MAVTDVKTYQTFRGVDYSASPAVISEEHASDMLNMYIGHDGVLQKRPGWHVLNTFTDGTNPVPINGIYFMQYAKGNGVLFVHAGTKLYGCMFTPSMRHIVNNANDPGDVPFFKYAGDYPTAAESSAILRYLAGYNDGFAEWQIKNMDTNGDGRITQEDAELILKMIVGLAPTASNGVNPLSYFEVKDSLDTALAMAPQRSTAFEHDGSLYVLDGVHYYVINPKYTDDVVVGYIGESVAGYIPTTAVNGHYEYLEPQYEVTTGDTIVAQETVTVGSSEHEAVFPALEELANKRILVTLIINSAYVCNALLLNPTTNTIVISNATLAYESGSVTVTTADPRLNYHDKVTLFIKEEDTEVIVAGEPGTQTNPGEWKKPENDEDRNLLQAKQINTFSGDGIHKAYYLYENNCVVDMVELYVWTRCKAVNGVDVPTHEHQSDVDAGTYTDPVTGETTYYYYKYIWTEVPQQAAFSVFSADETYAVGDKVKNDGKYYECTTAHSGAWSDSDFTEVFAWESRDASSSTPQQNEISYTTRIAFNLTPESNKDGDPNIRVTFEPRKHNTEWAVTKDRGYIEKCCIVTRFGYFNNNRFWLSGNPEHKNMDFMSAVDDPTYFPNTGWTKVGSDLTAIQGYLHYGSELAIVKEDNNQDATVYMRSAIYTEDGKILFPVQQGAQGVGAISKYCLKTLKDEPLFLAKEGVYAIQGTDASQERTIPNRSYFIDKKLQPEIIPGCVAEVYKDYYILCNSTTGHCWVADSRFHGYTPGTKYGKTLVYEWFPWDNIPARVMFATDDYLFFGTMDGRLCVFNTDWEHPKRWTDNAKYVSGSTRWDKQNPYDSGEAIHAYYVTKRDHLDSLDFKKTMLNDGGVIVLRPNIASSAAITVTTDKGSWFVDQIFTDSDEPSVVVPIRHRFKNFDSIETRVENKERAEGVAILGLQYRYVTTTNRR